MHVCIRLMQHQFHITQTKLKTYTTCTFCIVPSRLKMNTALEYSTRVVRERGRRCKKSTLNDLVHLIPLRIPSINPPAIMSYVKPWCPSPPQGSPAGRGYMCLGRGYLFWPRLFVPGRGYLSLLAKRVHWPSDKWIGKSLKIVYFDGLNNCWA